MDLLLNPRSIQLYSLAPYFHELYHRDLRQRIQHPADAQQHPIAPPLLLRKGRGVYFIPGNSRDLILYVSSVAACEEAILRSLPIENIEDLAPATALEAFCGVISKRSSLRPAWKFLNAEVIRRLKYGHTVVVADVERCAPSLNQERLHELLQLVDADQAACNQLMMMHRVWRQAGCSGLPLTGGLALLLNLYLADVDAGLQGQGIDFLRLMDDFRIFCGSSTDAAEALQALQQELVACGLQINPAKTRLIEPAPLASWLIRSQAVRHLFKEGIGLPFLNELLPFESMRPLATFCLRRLYGHRCQPVSAVGAER